MTLIVGFDPGGELQFGWCLAKDLPEGSIEIIATGLADNSDVAFTEVCKHAIEYAGEIVAAGIDSPLFWIPNGDRAVDRIVRSAVGSSGGHTSTVQHVNSLQGACLVQGILGAHLLRQKFPNIKITESHPKALLWILGVANKEKNVDNVGMIDLTALILCQRNDLSEHERDAAIGAFAASAMMNARTGWRDIMLDEKSPFAPVEGVHYFMPIPKQNLKENT